MPAQSPTVNADMQPVDLSAADVSLLRLALEEIQAASVSDRSPRPLLRQVCADARARHMSAASLIILLKETWRSLPENDYRTASRSDYLDRVISMCIEEYYGESGAPDNGRAGCDKI